MALVCCVSRPAHVGRSVSGRGSGPAVPSSSTAAPRSRGLRGCARPRGEQGVCAAAAVLSGGSGGGGASGGGAHNNGGPRRRWGWGPGGDGGFKRSFLLLAATFVAEQREERNAPEAPFAGLNPQVDSMVDSVTPQQLLDARPTRVALFVEPSPFTYVSGYNTRFRNTISQLVTAGCEVLCVTTGAGRSLPGVPFPAGVEPPSSFCGATVLGAPSFGCPFYWQVPLSFAATRKVFTTLRDFKPQVVHVTSPGVMLLAAWAYARILDVPLVMSYHTHVPEYLPRYGLGWLQGACWAAIRAAHARAHLTVAASSSLADELVRCGASPARLTKAWRKAVDVDKFAPGWRSEAVRRRLCGLPEHAAAAAGAAAGANAGADAGADAEADATQLLLYVGRLGAEKSVDTLQPLLASLPPTARLAIVGDGPARADLEAAFQADPLTRGRALFTGTLRNDALSAAYASADIFLMPSETETLGFVVLEAMASSLPVVAVAAGGLPDIVTQPGANGFLYQPGDAAGAQRQVRALMSDPALRQRVGAAARTESEQWGWAAATRQLLCEQYPLAIAMHEAGLHRWGARRLQQAGMPGGEGQGRRLVTTSAKLAALRGLYSTATGKAARRAAVRKAGKAGKAIVRRALAAL